MGKTWKELLNGLLVPYTSKIAIDTAREHHVLLGSETGIFCLNENDMWNQVQTNSWNSRSDTEHLKVRSLQQLTSSGWIAAVDKGGHLSSFDSAKTFSGGGTMPMWCISNVGAMYPGGKRKASWNSTIAGGPLGVQFGHRDDDVGGGLGKEIDTSIQNVAACLEVIDTSGWENTITIFGTLGDGIFVRNTWKANNRPYNKEYAYSREGRVGEQKLPGRQIWTLKSFLVSP